MSVCGRGCPRKRERREPPGASHLHRPWSQASLTPGLALARPAPLHLPACLQTAYEWALDVGGLDPSMYFGFSKDLYHFDHFMG